MIEKKIHYCWFGRGKKGKLFKKCLNSWKKFCPDFEIIEWNEDNYDITKNQYMLSAYKEKKYGFVPDYARFDIIFNEGGIYLDTDVELLRPIPLECMESDGFMGFEKGEFINGGIGFGAKKGNITIKLLRDMYDNISFYKSNGEINLLPSPYYITDFLVKKGLKIDNSKQKIENLLILPTEYLAPKNYDTGKIDITCKTISIHHYDGSWISWQDKLKSKIKKILKLK